MTIFFAIFPSFSYEMIDTNPTLHYNSSCFGRLAQLGEHLFDVQKVIGSNPIAPTIKQRKVIPQTEMTFFFSGMLPLG
jgi:hypothetical protein